MSTAWSRKIGSCTRSWRIDLLGKRRRGGLRRFPAALVTAALGCWLLGHGPSHDSPIQIASQALSAAPSDNRCEIEPPKKKAKKSAGRAAKSGSAKSGSGKEKTVDPKVAAARKERRNKAMTFLKASLQFAVSTDRRQAIQRIPSLESDEQAETFPILIKQANADSDPLVREASLRMLGRLKHEPAIPSFIKALDDESDEIVEAAIGAIGTVKAKAAGPKLVALIKKRSLKERSDTNDAIVRALGILQFTEASDFLRQKAADKETHEQTRQSILLFLGDVKDASSREYLQKITADSEQPVLSRAYAVNALGRIGDKSDSPKLRKVLADIRAMRNGSERAKLNGLRLQLISALIRLGDKGVEEELFSAARDDDAYVRTRAIKQLGELKLKSARPLLCFKYKHDASRAVRRAARKAILSVDGKDQ